MKRKRSEDKYLRFILFASALIQASLLVLILAYLLRALFTDTIINVGKHYVYAYEPIALTIFCICLGLLWFLGWMSFRVYKRFLGAQNTRIV
jgi:hypothetical protein